MLRAVILDGSQMARKRSDVNSKWRPVISTIACKVSVSGRGCLVVVLRTSPAADRSKIRRTIVELKECRVAARHIRRVAGLDARWRLYALIGYLGDKLVTPLW